VTLIPVASSEGPYGGTPAPIPGTVQTENYDTGGQGVAYNVTSVNGTDNGYRSDGVDLEACSDTGGGVDLGWESPGQWFKYTVNVATAGTYTVSFRVAAPGAVTDAFHLSNSSGTNLSGNINLPATGGYQTWATVTANVTLPAGQQILTLNEDNGGGVWNINYLGFASSGGGTVNGLTSGNLADAMVTDGTVFTGGIDGIGSALSATLLGSSLTWNGLSFSFLPANSNNGARNETISLPSGNFSTISLLGVAVNGNQTAQTFTVKYTDGSSDNFTQSLSNWGSAPAGYTGESTATTMAYKNQANGTKHSNTYYLHGYSFAINSSKTVSSLVLPANNNVVIVAIDLN
jgi:hypothetical protein